MRTPFQAGSLLFHPKWLPYPALPYPALPYRSAGQKVHWYSRLPYIQGYWGRWNSDLSWVLLNSKTQVDSPWLFLLRLSRSSPALKKELWIFLSEETHSHWQLFSDTEPHNLWCLPPCRDCPLPSVLVWPYRGQTYLTNPQFKESSRSDRSVQAKAEKVKSVNKTEM